MKTGYEHKQREINPYLSWMEKNSDFSALLDRKPVEQIQGTPSPDSFAKWQDGQGNDYGKMNVDMVPPAVTPPAPSPEAQPQAPAILDSIWGSLPEPKYDEARQKRIQNLQKVNAFGEGIKALGDVFALSRGALVNRRQDTGDNQRLYAMFQGYEDDYGRRMDDHNRQKFNLRLQQLLNDRAEQWRDRDYNFRIQESKRQQDNTDRQFAEMSKDREERREIQREDREIQAEGRRLEQERLEWQKKLPYIEQQHRMEQLDARNKNAISQYEAKARVKPNGGFILYDGANQPVYDLDKGQTARLLQIILKDPETGKLAEGDLSLMRAQFGEGMNTNTINNIVAYYWDKSPQAKEYLGGLNKDPRPEAGTTTQPTKSTGNNWDQYELK